MSPNSISHRLFVAALAPGAGVSGKQPVARTLAKPTGKRAADKAAGRATRKLGEWSWSGWQHTTI